MSDPTQPGTAPPPSDWITRFAGLIRPAGSVLDLAAGSGRHTRYFLGLGHRVVAVDRDVSRLADLAADAHRAKITAEVIEADLETGAPLPLAGRRFDGVVVTNYLYRPLFAELRNALAPCGVLLYETFGIGNEVYGRPRNPDHLLRPGELLELARGQLEVVAYESGLVERNGSAVIQRLCARRDGDAPARL
ncbi:MAG TPA: class I SAM-dependent methyltransferase [Alphaproteobacteria bacterium]|nr:class I SAM-dependent methyltransferase [Alphaproteobacteria bacterium]